MIRGRRSQRACGESWSQSGPDATAGLLSPVFDTFLIAAETGSLSAAARALRVRQSTVSRQIRELEDRLGVSVFERHQSGIRITDAGHQLYERLRHVRGLTQRAVVEARDIGAVRTGELRLGFIGSFATSPAKEILGRMREHHGALNLQLTELGATELVRQVLAHHLDCAWIASWQPADPILICEPLWTESLHLAYPATEAAKALIHWADLAGLRLLARPQAELDLLFQVMDKAGVRRPEIQLRDCSRESLIAMVADGDGVAIMPESFTRLSSAGVQFAPIVEPEALVAVHAVYRRDRDNPALRRLLAITRDCLRTR